MPSPRYAQRKLLAAFKNIYCLPLTLPPNNSETGTQGSSLSSPGCPHGRCPSHPTHWGRQSMPSEALVERRRNCSRVTPVLKSSSGAKWCTRLRLLFRVYGLNCSGGGAFKHGSYIHCRIPKYKSLCHISWTNCKPLCTFKNTLNLCFYFHFSRSWVKKDLAVIYVIECSAYVFL